MTPPADRRHLTWGEAYNKFVLGLIAIVLSLIGVICGAVGLQMREMTTKIQALAEEMAAARVDQQTNRMVDSILQKQIDETKVAVTRLEDQPHRR